MANTQKPNNPLVAKAIQKSQEVGSQSEDQFLNAFSQDSSSTDFFRDALAKNSQQNPDSREKQIEQLAAIHTRQQEMQEQQHQVVVLDSRRLAEEREMQQVLQEIKAVENQKQVPEPQQAKIAEAPVVDPKKEQYAFATLVRIALQKALKFVKPIEPYQVQNEKSAKRTGLNANAAVSKKQQMQLQHEFNVNGGA